MKRLLTLILSFAFLFTFTAATVQAQPDKKDDKKKSYTSPIRHSYKMLDAWRNFRSDLFKMSDKERATFLKEMDHPELPKGFGRIFTATHYKTKNMLRTASRVSFVLMEYLETFPGALSSKTGRVFELRCEKIHAAYRLYREVTKTMAILHDLAKNAKKGDKKGEKKEKARTIGTRKDLDLPRRAAYSRLVDALAFEMYEEERGADQLLWGWKMVMKKYAKLDAPTKEKLKKSFSGHKQKEWKKDPYLLTSRSMRVIYALLKQAVKRDQQLRRWAGKHGQQVSRLSADFFLLFQGTRQLTLKSFQLISAMGKAYMTFAGKKMPSKMKEKEKKKEKKEETKKTSYFRLDSEGKVFYNRQAMTLGRIDERLSKLKKKNSLPQKAIVRAQKKTPFQIVSKLMEVLKKYGIKTVQIGSEK